MAVAIELKLEILVESKNIIHEVKLEFLAQIAWEIEALEMKRYIILSEHFDRVGKQLGGWLKKLRGK